MPDSAASGPGPAETARTVTAEIARLAPPGPLGVAVSGGGDSTALLLIAVRWAADEGRPLAAATVDHGLRRESRTEAEAVAALCARLGLPHEILVAEGLGEDAAGNLQARARAERFRLLAAWAARRGLAAVLLGHTMDDQAETVLMRLARGSGVEGLAAMAPAMRHRGLLWLRPLLGVRRGALRALLEAEGIPWIEDPTNEADAFDRVKARRALAALEPLGLSVEGLAATAARLRRQRRVLERAMAALAARARRWGAFGEAVLDVGAMREEEADTALRLLADTLQRVAGAPYRPRFRALEALWERIRGEGPVAATLGGCLTRPAAGMEAGLLVCREPAAVAPAVVPMGGAVVWDDRWRLRFEGPWPGEVRVGALGEAGLAALAAAARAGAWEPPPAWAAAPREVRLTVPGVWREGVLLAAPLARWRSPLCPAGARVAAESLAQGELPFAALPD